jgi:hypothetical protein
MNTTVCTGREEKDDAVLWSVCSFLGGNTDLSRLRIRQQLFFGTYDMSNACMFEGLLSIPVDAGEEANPMHRVDATKECLAGVYKESDGKGAPAWKQM